MTTYRLTALDQSSYNAITRFTGPLHWMLMWGIGYVLRLLAPLTRHWPMYCVRRSMITSFRVHPSLMRLIRRSTLLLLGVRATEVALLEDQVVGPQEVSSVHLLEVGLPDLYQHSVAMSPFVPLAFMTTPPHPSPPLRIRTLHISVLVKDELLLLMSLKMLTNLHHPHPPMRTAKGAGDCSLRHFISLYMAWTSCITFDNCNICPHYFHN